MSNNKVASDKKSRRNKVRTVYRNPSASDPVEW